MPEWKEDEFNKDHIGISENDVGFLENQKLDSTEEEIDVKTQILALARKEARFFDKATLYNNELSKLERAEKNEINTALFHAKEDEYNKLSLEINKLHKQRLNLFDTLSIEDKIYVKNKSDAVYDFEPSLN